MQKKIMLFACLQVFLLRAMETSEQKETRNRMKKAESIVKTMRNREYGVDKFNLKKAEEIFKVLGHDEMSCFNLENPEDKRLKGCMARLMCENGFKDDCIKYLKVLNSFNEVSKPADYSWSSYRPGGLHSGSHFHWRDDEPFKRNK